MTHKDSSHTTSWELYRQLSGPEFARLGATNVYERIRAQLLYNRGLQTREEMERFRYASYADLYDQQNFVDHPETFLYDPYRLIDMPKAVQRIRKAFEAHEHITVYGDYDADGVTSSALLYRALRTLGHPKELLSSHIPHRQNDGCGLNSGALTMLKERGTKLIITTDCASSDVEQVEEACTLGIDVIITDHHRPPDQLPQAFAMVNPWRSDCTYPNETYSERYLCGAGIAFKLVQALYRAYQRSLAEEQELLDLAAIGTIADIAPLLGENHTLARLGLELLNRTNNPGLKELIKRTTLQLGKIRERDIAFAIAPRINAAGRMESALIAFDLLTTNDAEEAARIASRLDALNISRQQVTEELMRDVRVQAQLQSERPVVLVGGDEWHEGIIGLVAGKLADELQKPALVLSHDPKLGHSRGSARSQKGFNIIEALRGFDGGFERYGGHAQAAGFTIQSDAIERLHDHLIKWKENGGASIPAQIDGTSLPDQTGVVTESEPESEETSPTHMIDLEFERLRLQGLNAELYHELRQLSPFGAGNPEPVFKMKNLLIRSKWTSGRERQNLSLRLEQPGSATMVQGTLVRGAARINDLASTPAINIIFHLEVYDDNATQNVRLKLLDVEPYEAH
ncbi:single-stranded-DNA-specific exonuclease RecJ [Ktedonospora formicarum]|uniref:Single-stranded-DNA-specific exonuclease RecJ n=1 Tax=Ktedonospora formicarum TaxID=2778364 RepID=A0A8J3I213_9CHLR|nr:single-stranded-DNA-specific exonuclease RecJ [Ktedonospora formicarum]GHO44029.1 hypothetical protein KSX_21920 [Ktedonospora formicarum]